MPVDVGCLNSCYHFIKNSVPNAIFMIKEYN
jgi:hypothetical protein